MHHNHVIGRAVHFIVGGGICLILSYIADYIGVGSALQGAIYFAVFFGIGVYLGHVEERKELGLE